MNFQEALENSKDYSDFVISFVSDIRADDLDWNLETRFPLWYEPGSHGTCDFWAVHKSTKTLYVLDYKSGRIEVKGYKNPQLSIYAIAAYDELKKFNEIETVKLGIMQPFYRKDVDWWETDVSELEHVREQIDRVVREIDEPMFAPRFGPDEKACRWCYHKDNCVARKAELEGEKFKPIGEIEDEEALEIWGRAKRHREFLDAIEARVRSMDEDERARGGWKLVRGNKRRSWGKVEIDDLESVLAEHDVELYTRSPKTVAAIEKELGPDDCGFLSLYTETTFNKPSLVPVDDRRPAVGNEENK